MARRAELRPPTEVIDPSTGLALADYSSLPQSSHLEFQKLFESDFGLGRVYFFAECFKYNKNLTEQRRVLVVAKSDIFVMLPRAEVLRCMRLSSLKEIYACGSIIAFSIPDEYDLMIRITTNNKVSDVLSAEYLLYVLSVLAPDATVHRDVNWLNTKHSMAARETVREVLRLNRPTNWEAGTSCQVDRIPWRNLVMLPGFEGIWRKLHPSRSKMVDELRDKAFLTAQAAAAAAGGGGGGGGGVGGGDSTPTAGESRLSSVTTAASPAPSPTAAGGRRSSRGRASVHFPGEGTGWGLESPNSRRAATQKGGAVSYHDTVSAYALNTADRGDIGLFDVLASSAPMLVGAGGSEDMRRFNKRHGAAPRKVTRDTQTSASDTKRWGGGGGGGGGGGSAATASSGPPLPKGPPPPLPPHQRHSDLNRFVDNAGVKRGAPAISEHQSPHFQPTSVAKVGSGSPVGRYGAGRHIPAGGPGDEDGLEGLDPNLIELAAAASPVPYDTQTLQQAVRVMHDRERDLLVDTPQLRYADAVSPPTLISQRLNDHPDSIIERGPDGASTAGVRPGNYVSPIPITNPATAIWSRAELPPEAQPDGSRSPMADMSRDDVDGAAVDLARKYSEATYRPGGGGAASRRAIAEMLRSAAALIHIDGAVQDYDSKLQRVAKVTPTPKGDRRSQLNLRTIAAEERYDMTRDAFGDLNDSTGSDMDPDARLGGGGALDRPQSSAYLSSLLDEQERQRIGLDTVCKKLDMLLHTDPGVFVEEPPSPGSPKHAEVVPGGQWDESGGGGGGGGGGGAQHAPIGSPLLPIPDEARLSKYQVALRQSLRPLNHSPPRLKRKPHVIHDSQPGAPQLPRRLLTADRQG